MNIILLSGGSGKRLWPLSNDVRSKQFIKLFKNNDEYESMLQRVYRQITTVDVDAKITIATSKSQASTIKNQLGEKVSICVEPCRRDTFPAIALAAAYLHDELGIDENEAVVVCPVDPYVDSTYYETVQSLQKLVEQGDANLVLMGIEPTYPSEKYGYIIPESGENVSKVKEFKEKPDMEIAKKYLAQNALWNAGIFAFKLDYLLDKAHSMIDFVDYYLAENGNLTLLTSCDTVNAQNNDGSRVVQTAWLYPEKYQSSYNSKVKDNIEAMIRGMKIENGCIFFSGFIDKNQNFVFFECGYRLEGAHQYYYTQKRGPVNFLDIFIFYALCGNTHDVSHIGINENMKCVTVNVFAKEGTIAKIQGLEEIAKMPDCTLALLHGRVGEQCKADKAILDKICVFAFSSESVEQLKNDVDEAYSKLQIIDDMGNDMIYDRLVTSEILKWGDGNLR